MTRNAALVAVLLYCILQKSVDAIIEELIGSLLAEGQKVFSFVCICIILNIISIVE